MLCAFVARRTGKASERKQDVGIRTKPVIIFARFGYRDRRILIDDSDHSSRSGVGDLRAPIRVPAHIECRVLALNRLAATSDVSPLLEAEQT
jgi:hypothetical protein